MGLAPDRLRASSLLALVAVLNGCASGTAGSVAHATAAISPAAAAPNGRGENALERAASAWKAGDYLAASAEYEAIVGRDPHAPSVAIFRLATLRAWENRIDEGVGLFRRYVAMEPRDTEGRLALGRALAWGGRYSDAIAIYDSVIASDATYRDAVLARAQTLAWSGHLGEALSTYRRWLADHPSDREASVAYAVALSWNGQLDDAESLYAQLSGTGDSDAKKGLARVISWRGDLARSERTWREVLENEPEDPEALTGLAQVLSWQGRQTDAQTALERALRANRSYGDARALLRWVRADLRPSVTMTGVGSNDSDGNRASSLMLDYSRHAPWNGTVGARSTTRRATFAAIDSRADALSVFARWQPVASSWQLRADAGVARHSSTPVSSAAPERTIVGGSLRAAGTVGRSLTAALGVSRVPFDETAVLIASGVVSTEIAGDAEIALPSRLSLSGAVSHARLTGGARENSRNALSSALRWKHNRRWSVAIGARRFGYDTTSADGYFAPKKYTLLEASGRGRVGGTLGWNAEGDAGMGRQTIDLFGSSGGSRLTERVSLAAGYRFDPAREISAGGSYGNVAAPGQTSGSEYNAYTLSLRARVGF
ncbi:MAG TPA: tetratricopeptide repeat protein [Gemmatimonadaceae bacterium]|nr:tetratricopeptide repeat protein [Gemmatimonadaceae bacterium]